MLRASRHLEAFQRGGESLRWRVMLQVRYWGWAACALGIGCAGSVAQPPPNAATPEAAAEAVAESAVALPPLERVEPPPGVFVVGRARELASLVDTLSTWANVPFSLQDMVASELPQLADALHWESGAHVLMALDPEGGQTAEPFVVVSFGLRDYQQALESFKASGSTVERLSAYMHYVQLDGEQDCALARANGPAPARLVCGNGRKAVDALAPYAAATLAAEPSPPDDLWLRLDFAPLRAKYGKFARMLKLGVPTFLSEVSLGNARFDAAMADAAHATVDEILTLIEELDTLVWQATVDDAKGAIDGSLSVAFRGTEGYVSRAVQVASEQLGAAPEVFWQLPNDVDSASYIVEMKRPPRYESAVDTVGELLAGALEHVGLASGPLTAWVSELKQLLLSPGPSVTASGPATDAGASERSATADTFGYSVFGFRDQGALARWVNATITVWNDTRLRYELKNRGFEEAPAVPKIRTRSAPVAAKLPPATRIHEVEIDAALARKLDLEEWTDERGVKLTALVLIEGDMTWMVVALDEQLALRKLQQVLGDAPEDQLRGRTDLAYVQQVPAAWAVTMATLEGILRRTGEMMDNGNWVANTLRGLPHQGRVPLVVHAEAEPTPVFRLRFHVPRAFVEDASVAGVSAAAQRPFWK